VRIQHELTKALIGSTEIADLVAAVGGDVDLTDIARGEAAEALDQRFQGLHYPLANGHHSHQAQERGDDTADGCNHHRIFPQSIDFLVRRARLGESSLPRNFESRAYPLETYLYFMAEFVERRLGRIDRRERLRLMGFPDD
jgi:hypothetical protein